MIIGTGIDIVDIDRFTIVFNRHRERFLRKFFTEAEILYSNKYCLIEILIKRGYCCLFPPRR